MISSKTLAVYSKDAHFPINYPQSFKTKESICFMKFWIISFPGKKNRKKNLAVDSPHPAVLRPFKLFSLEINEARMMMDNRTEIISSSFPIMLGCLKCDWACEARLNFILFSNRLNSKILYAILTSVRHFLEKILSVSVVFQKPKCTFL